MRLVVSSGVQAAESELVGRASKETSPLGQAGNKALGGQAWNVYGAKPELSTIKGTGENSPCERWTTQVTGASCSGCADPPSRPRFGQESFPCSGGEVLTQVQVPTFQQPRVPVSKDRFGGQLFHHSASLVGEPHWGSQRASGCPVD